MAVSSIFHNVILDTPEKVEAFLDAADASMADPYVRPKEMPPVKIETDSNGYTTYTYTWDNDKGINE